MVPVSLVRVFLPASAWPVSRVDAQKLAGDAARAEGLPWLEPIKAYRHHGNWSIRSFANQRGGNVQVIIDAGTGDVVRISGPTPR